MEHISKVLARVLQRLRGRVLEPKEGKIIDADFTRFSGLGLLLIRHVDGSVRYVNCDNPSTIQAFQDVYGEVISSPGEVRRERLIGRKIRYWVDKMGVLDSFEPLD